MKKYLLILSNFFVALGAVFAADNSQRRGVLCLTFDDYGGENWIKADALFKKYDAHATFLFFKQITGEKARVMKKLQAAGHSVGLHTLDHRNADPLPPQWDMETYIENQVMPQLEACRKYGIKVRCFAYPNNRRSKKSDEVLFKYFDYLRAGWGRSKKPVLMPRSEIGPKMLLRGGGIGDYYKSDIRQLKKWLAQAHKRDALIVFVSHNIYPDAKHVHMPTQLLEELLKYAREELNMNIIGAEELLTVKSPSSGGQRRTSVSL